MLKDRENRKIDLKRCLGNKRPSRGMHGKIHKRLSAESTYGVGAASILNQVASVRPRREVKQGRIKFVYESHLSDEETKKEHRLLKRKIHRG